MPLSDDDIREKVIKHDYEFKSLTSSLKGIVSELHEITKSLKNVSVLNEKIENMDDNLKESFGRVYGRIEGNEEEIKFLKETRNEKGCTALSSTNNSVNILNRAVFGKEGRGGLIFDVADIKKFIYLTMGGFTVLNIAIAIIVPIVLK